MPLAGKVYVSTSSAGDLEACKRQVRELFVDLDAKTKAQQLEGYMTRIFSSAAELEAEDLPADRVSAAAGKRFPLLVAHFAWEGAMPAFLPALEKTYALKEIA